MNEQRASMSSWRLACFRCQFSSGLLILMIFSIYEVTSFSCETHLQKQGRTNFHNVNILYASNAGAEDLIDENDDLLRNYDNTPRTTNVKFVRPLLDYGYPPAVEEFQYQTLSDRPLLLYLPGFDGTYMSPFIQFPELGTEFDVWCMTVGMDDRSTFDELKQYVLDFILSSNHDDSMDLTLDNSSVTAADATKGGTIAENTLTSDTSKESAKDSGNVFSIFGNRQPKKKRPRKMYLAGESFGGILSCEVALTLLAQSKSTLPVDLKGLVLINAATCYDRSQLAAKGPGVANFFPPLYPFGLLRLLPLFGDEFSFEQLLLILKSEGLPSVIDNATREAYMGRVAFSLPSKLQYMPQGTLQWRLQQWLTVGCARMESRLFDLAKQVPSSFRTLIVAGENDLTLPSIAEAERLVNVIPNSKVHVVEGAGHSSTCGSRVDLTALMRSNFSELRKRQQKKGSPIPRTAMKEVAAQGAGPKFGLEPRYDQADIGLSPLLYWSPKYFRSTRVQYGERVVPSSTNTKSANKNDHDDKEIQKYSKAVYSILSTVNTPKKI